MAALNIRNLPDAVHAQLRMRAARAGRSMEAEARAILAAVCLPREECDGPSLQAWVSELYGGRPPADTVATLIRERRLEASGE